MSKGEETKQRIVNCAADLFWKRSYHGVSVADVAAAAGINKATLYQYFKSKDALAEAVVIYNRARVISYPFDAAFAEAEDAAGRLSGIYRRIYDVHKSILDKSNEAYGCPFVNMATELAATNEPVRLEIEKTFAVFADYYREIVRGLAETTRTKSEEDAVVAALIRNMNGAMIAAKVERRPEVILEALETANLLARH